MSLIELSNVSKVYQPQKGIKIKALNSVSLSLEAGISYALMGASGSGKSTLLGILGGLIRPCVGSYRYEGQPVDFQNVKSLHRFRNQQIGIVLQDFGLLENLTALENCLLPAIINGRKRKEANKRAEELLSNFEVDRYGYTKVAFLSGGERQRVAIARAMMNAPGLVLADEPTGSLDSKTSDLVTEVLTRITNHGATLLLATHNHQVAKKCNKTLTIVDGTLQSTS